MVRGPRVGAAAEQRAERARVVGARGEVERRVAPRVGRVDVAAAAVGERLGDGAEPGPLAAEPQDVARVARSGAAEPPREPQGRRTVAAGVPVVARHEGPQLVERRRAPALVVVRRAVLVAGQRHDHALDGAARRGHLRVILVGSLGEHP